MVLTVIWPLYALLDFKEEVSVEAGGFVERGNVIASRIRRVERDETMELSDSELRELVSEKDHNLMHRDGQWSLNPGYVFPINGLVLRCDHWNSSTLLDIHVIGQAPYDFGNAIEAQTAVAVPSFWADIDVEGKWRDLRPDTRRQWEIRKQRPKTDTEEAINARWNVGKLYHKHKCLDHPAFAQYTGYAETKVSYAERHRNRLAYIRDVRMCLYKSTVNLGPEDVFLIETQHESLLTVEALCFSAMAALDLLARAVDHLLSITVSPTQRRSRVTFSGLLGVREADEECEDTKKTLSVEHPDLALTKLWQNAWLEWIAPLARRRHMLAHDSILHPVEVVHSGLSFMDELPDSTNMTAFQSEDALEFADDVVTRLREFFRGSFVIVAEMAQKWSEQEEVDLPDYPPDLPLKEWSPTNVDLEEALDAWIAASAGDDAAAKTVYHRVHADLKKTWSLSLCESFLRSNKLISYRITKGTGHTDKHYGQISRALVRMTFCDHETESWISVARARNDRWHIIREPISTFADPVTRLECRDMWRKQSDRGSGFRDVLYGASIGNTSAGSLSNVTVTLCQGDRVAEYLELQTTAVGTLAPGETTPLDRRFEGGCLPPYGFRLLSGPLSLRFCYDTEDGQRYAGDFPFEGPTR